MSNTMEQILEKLQSILYPVFLTEFLFMLTLLSRSTWTKSWDARWCSVKMKSYEAMLFRKASITSPSILNNCLTIYPWVCFVHSKHGSEERSARTALGCLQPSVGKATEREKNSNTQVRSHLNRVKSTQISLFGKFLNSCLCNFFFKYLDSSHFTVLISWGDIFPPICYM